MFFRHSILCVMAISALAATAVPTFSQTTPRENVREVRVGQAIVRVQPATDRSSTVARILLDRVAEIEAARISGIPLAPPAQFQKSTTVSGLHTALPPVDLMHVLSVRPLEIQPEDDINLREPAARDPLWMQLEAWGTACHRLASPAGGVEGWTPRVEVGR